MTRFPDKECKQYAEALDDLMRTLDNKKTKLLEAEKFIHLSVDSIS